MVSKGQTIRVGKGEGEVMDWRKPADFLASWMRRHGHHGVEGPTSTALELARRFLQQRHKRHRQDGVPPEFVGTQQFADDTRIARAREGTRELGRRHRAFVALETGKRDG
jgi:hypothetical protein